MLSVLPFEDVGRTAGRTDGRSVKL
jgi:hypothetical protein